MVHLRFFLIVFRYFEHLLQLMLVFAYLVDDVVNFLFVLAGCIVSTEQESVEILYLSIDHHFEWVVSCLGMIGFFKASAKAISRRQLIEMAYFDVIQETCPTSVKSESVRNPRNPKIPNTLKLVQRI